MDRVQLEAEVFKRLRVSEVDVEVIKRAISRKPTCDLEDILKRMTEEGR